jgi:hypothetical protein
MMTRHDSKERPSMAHKIAALVLVALLAAGCSGGGAADQQRPSATPTPTCFQYSQPYCETPEPTETPASDAEIDQSDIQLTIKTRSKKCYGYGVGCSIEYRIKVAADRFGWPKDGTLDVTYKVTGGQDGPDRNTLTMDLTEGTYEQDGYQYADTRSSGVKLKASVVELEYSEW